MDGHHEFSCSLLPLLVMHLVASQGSKGRSGYVLKSIMWKGLAGIGIGAEVAHGGLEKASRLISLWMKLSTNRGQFQDPVPTFGDL